jgi:hypothetical protein
MGFPPFLDDILIFVDDAWPSFVVGIGMSDIFSISPDCRLAGVMLEIRSRSFSSVAERETYTKIRFWISSVANISIRWLKKLVIEMRTTGIAIESEHSVLSLAELFEWSGRVEIDFENIGEAYQYLMKDINKSVVKWWKKNKFERENWPEIEYNLSCVCYCFQ